MTALIKITENNNQRVVSARELHSFLEISERFSSWCKRMFEYGFEKDKDYIGCKYFNALANQHLIDYALTLDTSKEISMLQRSEKGKMARQYFIECEKKLMQSIPVLSRKDLALMVIEQEECLELLQAENNKLKPRSEFVDLVFATNDLIKMSEVAKVLELPYGRNTLFKILREKGVLFKNRNEPKQDLVSKGYFKLKEISIKRSDDSVLIRMQTLVTQKGLGYIAKILEVVIVPKQLMKTA